MYTSLVDYKDICANIDFALGRYRTTLLPHYSFCGHNNMTYGLCQCFFFHFMEKCMECISL